METKSFARTEVPPSFTQAKTFDESVARNPSLRKRIKGANNKDMTNVADTGERGEKEREKGRAAA